MPPSRETRAIDKLKRVVREVEKKAKQLDLQIKEVREAMGKMPPYTFKAGSPTWSFSPGGGRKKRPKKKK